MSLTKHPTKQQLKQTNTQFYFSQHDDDFMLYINATMQLTQQKQPGFA